MAFTRPKAAQIDFDLTNISDPLIRINSAESGDNTNDLGIVFERGNHTNAAIVWDESADTFRLISTTHDASTHTSDINISDHHNITLKRVTQSEQQYTTSNMMKFNQLYTGAANGSYFTVGEYQKVVTIIPSANSQNYQVIGRITAQNAGAIHTIDFNVAMRSETLPALAYSTAFTEQYTQKLIKPQLWHKQTTTAGFIVAFEVLASTIYGNVTVDIDVVPRASDQKSNVTVNTTQDSETTSVDTGYTAVDMQNIYSLVDNDLIINDADNVFMHGDTDYIQKQYVLYGTTSDASETEIFIGGTANSRIPVATNTTVFYQVDIVARRTDATGESGGWHLKSVADNFSGTVADVGSVYEVQVASDDANFAVDARADDTNDAIGIHVTGAASKTIRWTAVVRTFEVAQ